MSLREDFKEIEYTGDTTEIYCTFLHKTDKALLVQYDGEEIWFPLTAVKILEGAEERNRLIELEVDEWIAIEKEII